MHLHKCSECQFKSAAAKNLNEEEFAVLEKNSVRVSFKRGELIIKQGALSLNVAYLLTGIVKTHMRGPVSEKILRIVKAPTYLGIPTTFGDKINQISVTALEDSTVCFIDAALFRSFIYSNGKFAYEIIVDLCKNELFDYHRSAGLAQKQVPGMVAETLLCLADTIYKKDNFSFPLTQHELGDLVGVSRESVSRVLSEFSSEKIIAFSSRNFTILDKERLRQISEKG
jgi:CRP/FNR family transcriptional regulator